MIDQPPLLVPMSELDLRSFSHWQAEGTSRHLALVVLEESAFCAMKVDGSCLTTGRVHLCPLGTTFIPLMGFSNNGRPTRVDWIEVTDQASDSSHV